MDQESEFDFFKHIDSLESFSREKLIEIAQMLANFAERLEVYISEKTKAIESIKGLAAGAEGPESKALMDSLNNSLVGDQSAIKKVRIMHGLVLNMITQGSEGSSKSKN
jgi:hypothetical protein